MPQKTSIKFKVPAIGSHAGRVSAVSSSIEYAELKVTSNFSFLHGASHAEELVGRASELGYCGIALTDINTLAGVVRAHIAAKECAADGSVTKFIVGSSLSVVYEPELACADIDLNQLISGELTLPTVELLAYPTSRTGYGNLCRLLTKGNLRVEKGSCLLTLADIAEFKSELSFIVVPPHYRAHYHGEYNIAQYNFTALVKTIRELVGDQDNLSIALTQNYLVNNHHYTQGINQIARHLNIPLVATNDVYYHIASRKPLQDTLTAIRNRCTVKQCGYKLFENSERYLKPLKDIAHLYRDFPAAIRRTVEIAEQVSGFSLAQLKYEYPREILAPNESPASYLERLTWEGAQTRYPDGVPAKVRQLICEELKLIRELAYERYFLTCYDIVKYARSLGILCQGRGAAANSAVCYCLGITSVDPTQIDLLFARFVSKERSEPPDIDIDFEHERREEVIQYIYNKYGRERAGLTAEVVTFRQRSAVREIAKALGFSQEIVDRLAKQIHRWTKSKISDETLAEIGLAPTDPTVRHLFELTEQLIGFPRHLSQHVGGFVICERALCESVPILNAAMDGRTNIEWDKDDIEALGMLKIDVLGLGMLSCIRRALDLIHAVDGRHLELHTIPREDPVVYEMISRADTVGVFQIESRAQMSMLPRLKPRCFYDLVIEVAIVRPGPIQGNMVHPYLRRRSGLEQPFYPDKRVEEVLGKTLGVPIFQEQAMRLVIVLANFSPGEAEQLRRAMQAWKRNKNLIAQFRERIIAGMIANGYTAEFGDTCVNQIRGFSEYGFPESHAASFALLVYASAWIKCRYPVHFAAALINSQPMGFYAPAQIVADLTAHGFKALPIDINSSGWDCTIEKIDNRPALRLGMRLITGINKEQILALLALRASGEFRSIADIWRRRLASAVILRRTTLTQLARADSFVSLGLTAREAIWEIRALPPEPLPLDHELAESAGRPGATNDVALPQKSLQLAMFDDYRITGLSLKAHPLQFLREYLDKRFVSKAIELKVAKAPIRGEKRRVSVAGVAIFRQRPGTAKGVVFITLEDETGVVNLIIGRKIFERYTNLVISSRIILASGVLERIGEVVYVSVDSLQSLDRIQLQGSDVSQPILAEVPSKSYSY